jgi:hypothetical protein
MTGFYQRLTRELAEERRSLLVDNLDQSRSTDMAKKRQTTKKATAKKPGLIKGYEPPPTGAVETVSVSLGLKPSKDYASADFNAGITLQFKPGESPEKALSRALKEMEDWFDSHVDSVIKPLLEKNAQLKASR